MKVSNMLRQREKLKYFFIENATEKCGDKRTDKTTKELRTMLIKLIYKILKKLIDNCDKFYLEETDPDVIEAKELLGRVEKAMKAKGDDANAHQ